MSKLRLSVLDQSPIKAGGNPADAINETLELARHCDHLGYHRYWLAEHHGSTALAGSSPEVLTARVAGLTKRIRVGAGGILLNHYAPKKVAETFRTLEALFPGRIDLGLGRAPGGNAGGNGGVDPAHYPKKVQELLEYLKDENRQDGKQVQPQGSNHPQVWLLGSSAQSAQHAAQLGLPFSYAHFINADGSGAALEVYRRHFCPSTDHPHARGGIGVFVICAETQEEAEFLALSHAAMMVHQRTGVPGPVPAPEVVRKARFTPPQQKMFDYFRRRAIVGTPDAVRHRLTQLAEAHKVDEVVVVTITYDHLARMRSYDLLAQEF